MKLKKPFSHWVGSLPSFFTCSLLFRTHISNCLPESFQVRGCFRSSPTEISNFISYSHLDWQEDRERKWGSQVNEQSQEQFYLSRGSHNFPFYRKLSRIRKKKTKQNNQNPFLVWNKQNMQVKSSLSHSWSSNAFITICSLYPWLLTDSEQKDNLLLTILLIIKDSFIPFNFLWCWQQNKRS